MEKFFKFILTLVALVGMTVLSVSEIHAQDKSLKINSGFMLVPNTNYLLDANDFVGFRTSMPLFAIVSFKKEKTVVTPFYNFTFNACGVAFLRNIREKISGYIVANKSVLHPGGYWGAGVGTPVANDQATAFVEIGNTWPSRAPAVYLGLFVPFTAKIKR